MKNLAKVVLGALALTLPAASNAQVATGVTVSVINDNTFRTGATGYTGAGGGYFASFTVDLGNGTRTFNEWLLWCIDPSRSVAPPRDYTFSFYTVEQFAAAAYGSADTGHDLDLGDVKSIASMYTDAAGSWGMLTGPEKKNYQGSIWSEFDGFSTYNNNGTPILAGNRSFNTRDYYVLYNGSNQSFITYISEPSSALLLLAGIAGVLVAARRRNNLA
ncbi:MAG: PEP-CTERM sorting domain-containing protein [Gemmatimonadota bacterium]|nr:PEP-CTERM sorting domain-containing protein [Gemmatimonadota bacterium]